MKLYIDDLRTPETNDYIIMRDSKSAIDFIKNHLSEISEISFDHDLGDVDTTIPILEYLEELAFNNVKFDIDFYIHSMNPIGRKNIQRIINSIHRFLSTTPFNFDLERMKEAMESPRIKIPDYAIATDDAFEEWINNE
jgi:hypothetical protein